MTVSEFLNKVGFSIKKEDVDKVNNTISDIKNTATKVLGAIGIGFSLTSMNALVEEFGRINNQIKNSTKELGNQDEIQQKILSSASLTRTSYEQTAKMVSNLVHENANLFGTIEEAVEFNNAATMLFKTAGKTNEEIAGLMESINKSFAKGYVDSETLSQMLERSPEAVELLNNYLGTTSDQLEKIASEGGMTVEDLKNAFVNSSGEIQKNFGNVAMTISDALQVIRNKWGLWLTKMDETMALTKTISKVMVSAFDKVMIVLEKIRTGVGFLAQKLGGPEKLLKAIAIAAGSIFLAFNFSKIKAGITSIGKILSGANLKIMAIAAVIVLVALLIEDLINFMQGNNSVIGSMFEKAGVDGNAFRESIASLWEQIKGLLPVIIDLAKSVGSVLLDALKSLLPLFLQLITSIIPVLIDLIKMLIPFVVQIIQTILPVIIDLISKLIPIVVQIIQKLLPVIIDLINKLLPLVMQIIETVLPIIIDLINKLLPLVMQIIEMILPIIIQLIETLIPIIIQIIDGILPVIIELITTLLPLIMQIIETILPIIIELINTLLPIIIQIIEAVLPIIIDLINTLLPLFMQIIEAILPVIISLIEAILPILEPIFGLISSLAEAILPIIIDLLDAIIPIINGVMKVLQPLADIFGVIIGAITKVVGWVADGLGWVIDLFFGGGDEKTAKKVNAYADGTEYTSDTFIAGEEGPELITGQPGKKVFTALETGSIFQSLALLARAQHAGPQSVMNTSNSRVVNQYNEFVNTFNGDIASQQKTAKVMSDATGIATSELARGLAFAK